MFSAADLLEALRRRRTLKSIRPEEPGRLPPGWEQWLEQLAVRPHAVTGAPAPGFIEVFAQRPLRPPPRRAPVLSRWQAFATLWRQQWHPARRDERGLRIFAMGASLVVHACFAVALAWLMYLHLLVLLAAPPMGEAAVVQVEYIGTGTPEDVGGGALEVQQAPAESPRQAAAAPGAAAAPAPAAAMPAPRRPAPREIPVEVETPDVAASIPPLPRREIPTPALPETSQPLQVTEVARPDIDFVLPPTTTQVDALPQPEVAVPTRDVPQPEVVEAVEADLPSRLPTVAVAQPDPGSPDVSVPLREVPAPEVAEVARLPERAVQAPVVDVQGPPMQVPSVAIATIPDPAERPEGIAGAEATATGEAAGDATDDATGDPAADATDGERVAGEATASEGTAAPSGTPSASPGAGPEIVAAPGGWPSPTRGDDWDDALSDRPGGEAGAGGLFDSTGRPRLAGTGEGGPPGGAPPGSEARQAIDLERGGTWLRRPPFDYEPTRFDRFWVPTGTLLEEWVRRGIKQMTIPIPGTSMEIVCVVSILQLGGGCGLSNLNVNEEPSTGRAAPDIPFKPELQEDQDSLARPPGG